MRKTFKGSSQKKQADPTLSLITGVLFTTVFLVPLVIAPNGRDIFRLPKEIVTDAGAILIAAISIVAFLFGRMNWRWWRAGDVPVLVTLCLAWTLITTFASSNRVLSMLSLVTAATAAIVALAAYFTASRLPLRGALMALWVPAVTNSVFVILQRLNIWNPFTDPTLSNRLWFTALLGNPNDVGMYLVTPVLTACEYGFQKRSRLALALATVCAGGIVASQTLTALMAVSLGLVVLLGLRFQRQRKALLITALIVVIPVSTIVSSRAGVIVQWAREGNYDRILSGRLPAFMAAWQMFRDHPLLGVGPGCFGSNYYGYRIALDKRYSKLAGSGSITQGINFEFVHNDFLEVAAETGIPGLGLLLLSLVVVARPPNRGSESPKADLAAAFAFAARVRPALATAAVILMLAQFPLQVAASTTTMLYAAGLCMGWSSKT